MPGTEAEIVAVSPALPASSSSQPNAGSIEALGISQAILEASQSPGRDAALAGMLELVRKWTPSVCLAYYSRNGDNQLAMQSHLRSRCSEEAFQALTGQLEAAAVAAVRRRATQVKPVGSQQGLLAVAVPVAVKGRFADALGVVLCPGAAPVEPILVVLQLAAAVMGMSTAPGPATEGLATARTRALLVLLGKILAARSRTRAASVLADELQSRGKFTRVAVGLCDAQGKNCRLAAISGAADFDSRTELARQLETVLEEAVLRGAPALWPPSDESGAGGTASQKRLCEVADAGYVASSPLVGADGEPVGAWVCLGRDPAATAQVKMAELAEIDPYLASCIDLLPHRRGAVALISGWLGSWRGWKGAAKIACGLLIAAVLAMPFPYKVTCNCSMQPVTRRFVAAPFAARLDEVVVEPGDLVSEGQLLARMDGREIRWELAALTAELSRATKMHDSSLAIQDVAAAQLASLEAERLQKKIDLLEERVRNLEIRAPIGGLVIGGDLKKTQGAPVPTGQPLFEIAPLDRMLAEVRVPDREISHVAVGQPVTIRLDAHPRLVFDGQLARIHPRAEIQESENVFIAEVLLDNHSQILRPGMHGETKIVTERHPLAWNLFHTAYEQALRRLGW